MNITKNKNISNTYIYNKKNNYVILYILIISISIITFYKSITQTIYANGWDAYYYIIQTKSLIIKHKLHSQDISPIYWLLWIITKVVKNYVLSYKYFLIILRILFLFTIIFSFSNILKIIINFSNLKCINLIRKFKHYFVLIMISIYIISPSFLFFNIQFPKNFLGFIFLILFTTYLTKTYYIQKKSKKITNKRFILNLSITFIFFILTFITHRLCSIISIIFILFFSILSMIRINNNNVKFILTFLITIIIIVFFYFVLKTNKFKGLISIYDFQRLKNLFQFKFNILPYLFINILGKHKFLFIWKLEIYTLYSLSLLTIIIFIYIILQKKILIKYKEILITFFPFIFLSLPGCFPLFKFDINGFSYRLYLTHLIFSPYLYLFLFLILLNKFVNNLDYKNNFNFINYISIKEKFINLILFVIIIIFSLISFKSYKTYNPHLFDPPYSYYHNINLSLKNKIKNKQIDLLVAHKGLAEFTTYFTGYDVLPWKPESFLDKTKIWRLSADIPFNIYLIIFNKQKIIFSNKLIIPILNNYVLIREDIYENFTKLIKDPYYKIIINSWKNPNKIRPKYFKNN